MKKLLISILGLTLIMNDVFAQTKLIAHKSHSGNMRDFKKSLCENLFDVKASNFGDIPMKYVKNSKLDSVIFISSEKTIMITSKAWHYNYQDTTIWKPGREIVKNHPLLSKQHALDSIKLVLKSEYYFTNSIDSVVFIGYDNLGAISKKKQKNSTPLISLFNRPNKPTPFSVPLSLIVLGLFMGSISFGFIYMIFNRGYLFINL